MKHKSITLRQRYYRCDFALVYPFSSVYPIVNSSGLSRIIDSSDPSSGVINPSEVIDSSGDIDEVFEWFLGQNEKFHIGIACGSNLFEMFIKNCVSIEGWHLYPVSQYARSHNGEKGWVHLQ